MPEAETTSPNPDERSLFGVIIKDGKLRDGSTTITLSDIKSVNVKLNWRSWKVALWGFGFIIFSYVCEHYGSTLPRWLFLILGFLTVFYAGFGVHYSVVLSTTSGPVELRRFSTIAPGVHYPQCEANREKAETLARFIGDAL